LIFFPCTQFLITLPVKGHPVSAVSATSISRVSIYIDIQRHFLYLFSIKGDFYLCRGKLHSPAAQCIDSGMEIGPITEAMNQILLSTNINPMIMEV